MKYQLVLLLMLFTITLNAQTPVITELTVRQQLFRLFQSIVEGEIAKDIARHPERKIKILKYREKIMEMLSQQLDKIYPQIVRQRFAQQLATTAEEQTRLRAELAARIQTQRAQLQKRGVKLPISLIRLLQIRQTSRGHTLLHDLAAYGFLEFMMGHQPR